MVAHSASRDKINNVHMEAGKIVSNDFLPQMNELAEMMEKAHLDVIFRRDDEEYYIAVGCKH